MIELLFCLTFFTYVNFLFFIISGLFRHNILPTNDDPNEELPIASVVIAARNEEENLPALLKDLTIQSYPPDKTEVIIVNDRSTDRTKEILERASKKYSFIKTVTIIDKSKDMTPKKHALNQGINISKGEIIISTDADCRVGKNWVLSMVNSTIKSKGITVGFSKVLGNSFLSQYQLIDFLGIITANAGAFGWGKYWSGTGQNLAYLKSDYVNINGFDLVKDEISGDDMYLVQKISKLKSGFLNIDPQSFVETKPVKTISQFINQRTRWASNSKKNIKSNKLFFMFLLSAFLTNILTLINLFYNFYFFWFFVFKSLLESLIIFLGSKLFNLNLQIKPFILWLVLQPAYIPYIGIRGLIGKFYWKV
tara:strand:- start:128 stop:1222 length:1095 start_codon:yes stop_codon:yes gene_type:complete